MFFLLFKLQSSWMPCTLNQPLVPWFTVSVYYTEYDDHMCVLVQLTLLFVNGWKTSRKWKMKMWNYSAKWRIQKIIQFRGWKTEKICNRMTGRYFFTFNSWCCFVTKMIYGDAKTLTRNMKWSKLWFWMFRSYEISSKDGKIQSLLIQSLTLQDAGVYTCKIGDRHTDARLTVNECKPTLSLPLAES